MSLKSNKTDDTEHKINKYKDNYGLDSDKAVSKPKTYNTLSEFISANKAGFGTKQETHMVWLAGSEKSSNILFKVNDEDYEKFLELYISDCKNNFGRMSILEKPCDMGPLILDYDLKQVSKERTITSDDTLIVVEIINNIIKKFYDIDDDDLLTSYILMKKEPFHLPEKKCYSDGFHIHYPNIVIPSEQRFFIFEESKKEIIKRNLFSEVFNVLSRTRNAVQKAKELKDNDTDNIIDSDEEEEDDEDDDEINYYEKLTDSEKEEIHNDVFDESVIIRNKWFLYGSGKNINGKWNIYQLSYIFDADGAEIENRPSLGKLIKILSIRGNDDSSIELKNTDEIKKKMEKIRAKYVTKTLNKKLDMGKIFIKNEDSDDEKEVGEKEVVRKLKVVNDENTDKNIVNAKKLIKLLKPERAFGYDDWIRVGWALYDTSQTLLPEFIQFSKKAPAKYKDGCCEKIWRDCDRVAENHQLTGYTIASLFHWAKEDNPEGYEAFRKETLHNILEAGNVSKHDDIAEVIYSLYKFEFVCSSCKKNEWWHFSGHRWQKIEEDITLSQKLSKEVSVKFQRLAIDYFTKSANSTGRQSDDFNKQGTEIKKLADNLKDVTFKKKILAACREKFYVKDFVKSLDQNNYLVGFENGIYDLRTAKFRGGYPDDLVSKSTGYRYREFRRDDPILIDIEKFFKSIQPEDDMRSYILCYLASLFEGSNKDQKFMVWTGSGSNGKGTLIQLIDHTLGEYYCDLDETAVTQKRGNSSSATPELADKVGVRSICLQEPNADDKLNLGFIKHITGEDKIQVRPLYGEPFYFVPQFKLLLACNHLPNVPDGGDGGTWRRIRVIPFEQKFVSKPSGPGEQPLDNSLREKLKTWNQALAWLLLNVYYTQYKDVGLDQLEPERVKIATNKYQNDSNIYIEFINEYIIYDPRGQADKSTLWEIFKQWFSGAYELRPPPLKKLLEFFETQKNCVVKPSCVKGIQIKDKDEQNNPIDA
jgi:P4 family phage/plasmid primase-like protien